MNITPLRRAFNSMNSIHARILSNGKISLRGKETYYQRNKIRKLGGFWNEKDKHWTVPTIREALLVNAIFMVRVTVEAHCHEPIQAIWVSHKEAQAGVVRLGCGRCDTSFQCGDDVEILCLVDTQLYNTVVAYELAIEEEIARVEYEKNYSNNEHENG